MDAFLDNLRSIDLKNLSISYLMPISESIVDFLIECNDNLHDMDMEQLEQYKELCNYILTFISTIFGKDSKINNGYRMEKDENLRKKLKDALKELKDIYIKSIYKNVNKIISHINRKIEIENYKTILFSDPKYFDIHFVAELERCNQLTKTEDIAELERIGGLEHIGGYPSLAKMENWPTNIYGMNLTFIAQFVYNINIHNEKILYRVFADLKEISEYYTYIPIKITEKTQFITNMKLIYPESEYPIIPKYKINNWIEHKVLKSYSDIHDIHDISITKEEYDQINLNCANIGFTVIRFPTKMPPSMDLDKLPMCNIPSHLLDKKNDDRCYHFYHQGKFKIV